MIFARLSAAVALAIALAAPAHAAPSKESPAVVQVMVLGTYHLGNPGMDLNNARADDPTTPRRQAELQRITDALKRFRPTKIMVERMGVGPALETRSYPNFTRADLLKEPDEGVQIGYRLARELGHEATYGIDEREKEGGPSYFPFGPVEAFSKEKGDGRADAMMAMGKSHVGRIETEQKRGIADALLYLNDPNTIRGDQVDGYYGILTEGAQDRQPGAELNGAWYLRNAKIFAKLSQVTAPGDRVLVIFGAGHAYWLRHFASSTPGFTLVDATPYLKAAR